MIHELLLTHEVATLLGRTPEAVRAMERRGALRAVRVGHIRLFDRRQVEEVLRRRAQGVKSFAERERRLAERARMSQTKGGD